jgi:hypothetical protein
MAEDGWDPTFDDPIPLPGGGELRTLRDAGNYIAKLPRREYDTFACRAAIEALMLVARKAYQANASAALITSDIISTVPPTIRHARSPSCCDIISHSTHKSYAQRGR